MVNNFENEAELCEQFIKHCKGKWTCYPETHGFDILIVRKTDGFQIGIEAKMKLNAKVICQISEPVRSHEWQCDQAPDCRAVLIPRQKTTSPLAELLDYLHITPIIGTKQEGFRSEPEYWFTPTLPNGVDVVDNHWQELFPIKRCKLPDFVPDVKAGVPSPLMLTPWKVNALKIAILLEEHGFVTRADFKRIGINISLWTQSRWIVPDYENKRFIVGKLPNFKEQHPINWKQIKDTYNEWAK